MEEEWAAQQTIEDKFWEVAATMTHLGPRSAQHAIPYPPLLTTLTTT